MQFAAISMHQHYKQLQQKSHCLKAAFVVTSSPQTSLQCFAHTLSTKFS